MQPNFTIHKLHNVEEMEKHYDLVHKLTPQLSVSRYKELLAIMVKNHYRQVAVFDQGHAIALSGYWMNAKLYSGEYLEIDNFIVDESYRSKGVGRLLVSWLEEEAKLHDCKVMMLDAYTENDGAHRFYKREGFHIRGFHFLKWM
ncbi:MAG: GNAT family N-acetyltransferase [Bacteroidota bacterium]|nr:GNAT family N-acetyltransferase [Bacteroidota bacterium]